jgi:polysaccharide chain length determinant protein (PEP-CTERM system associated)
MDGIDEIKDLILHYVRAIWKNRWVGIGAAWVVLMVGILGVEQLEDRYKAETKVYIDSSSVLRPLLEGLAIESDFQAIVQLMVRQLLSRPNMERAVRLMDMDIKVNGPKEMEELIDSVKDRIRVVNEKNSSIYTISFTDTDRLQSKKMVQTLLNIFVEDAMGKSVKESDSAIDFLDNQIQKYDTLLMEAEQRREAFRRKNIGLMPKDGANYFSQLQESSGLLEQAKLSLAESVNRRENIFAQIESLKSDSSAQNIMGKSTLDVRIDGQESNLGELLLLYTDEHPDVINAQLVLSSLRDRKLEEQQATKNNNAYSIVDNPVYQELQILLSTTEADISSFRTRVASLRAKQTELKKLVDIVPKIESELQRLNRDYEVHRNNYSDLVGRREQAKISEDVETGSEQVKFRIIEPPFVSLKPDFPNRALFDGVVLIVALGIGYGISLLMSLFQPIFYNQKGLGNSLGRAVLGSISKFDTPSVLYKRRFNVLIFSILNLLLIITAVFFAYFHNQGALLLNYVKALGLG